MGNKFLTVVALISIVALTSCDNKNIFGKFVRPGSSASIEVLLSDANAALANGNFAQAKAIADKILAKDPNNSEALYISAAAGLREAGFDVAGIITSVISSTSTTQAESLIQSFENLDLKAIAAAISVSIGRLKQISDGNTNGVIPADDIDVNLNLGILEVLNAAINIIDFADDLIEVDNNYNVTVKVGTGTYTVRELTFTDVDQLDDALADQVSESIAQIASAIVHFTVAANGVSGGSSVVTDLSAASYDLKTELEEFYSKLISPDPW